MNDRRLFKLSLSLSVVGLILLGVGVSLREPRHTQIDSITVSDRGEIVRVTGIVEDVVFNGEHLFFKLTDGSGTIKVVVFENDLVRQDFYGSELADGARVAVKGRIELYKGTLELVANRVTLL